MLARIYRPAKSAMQSGIAGTERWRLVFEPEAAQGVDPLMGWTSGTDTDAVQVTLEFDAKEAAVAYAEQQGIPYQVFESPASRPVPKAYGDNFAFRRRKPWTH
jgi:hypothetical protein